MHHQVILFFILSFFLSTLFSSLLFSSFLGVRSRSVLSIQAIHNIGSWVYGYTSVIPVVPTSQDGSTRSDPPAGGQEKIGGISHSESMMADMLKMLTTLTMQN